MRLIWVFVRQVGRSWTGLLIVDRCHQKQTARHRNNGHFVTMVIGALKSEPWEIEAEILSAAIEIQMISGVSAVFSRVFWVLCASRSSSRWHNQMSLLQIFRVAMCRLNFLIMPEKWR
jgi:hypothetical protein